MMAARTVSSTCVMHNYGSVIDRTNEYEYCSENTRIGIKPRNACHSSNPSFVKYGDADP
jgi:hypothetical protein